MPLLLALLEERADHMNDPLRRSGRCLLVVSEGQDVGPLGARHDPFRHVEFGACDPSAQQAIVSYFNRHGLVARGFARGNLPDTDQRDTSAYASVVDLE